MIEYKISADVQKYNRQIYSGLDWLGDVGGLVDGLRLCGYMLVAFLQFLLGNPLNRFLIESLFKREANASVSTSSLKTRIKHLRARIPFSISLTNSTCLRKAKEKRMLREGLTRASKELELDEFIKLQKNLRVTLRTLFTKLERFMLVNQRCFVIYSSSDSEDVERQVKVEDAILNEHPYLDMLQRGT